MKFDDFRIIGDLKKKLQSRMNIKRIKHKSKKKFQFQSFVCSFIANADLYAAGLGNFNNSTFFWQN